MDRLVFDGFVVAFVLVSVQRFDAWYRQGRHCFSDRMEIAVALLLVVLLQLVFQHIRLFSGVVLGVPEVFSAFLEAFVATSEVCCRDKTLVVFQRAFIFF